MILSFLLFLNISCLSNLFRNFISPSYKDSIINSKSSVHFRSILKIAFPIIFNFYYTSFHTIFLIFHSVKLVFLINKSYILLFYQNLIIGFRFYNRIKIFVVQFIFPTIYMNHILIYLFVWQIFWHYMYVDQMISLKLSMINSLCFNCKISLDSFLISIILKHYLNSRFLNLILLPIFELMIFIPWFDYNKIIFSFLILIIIYYFVLIIFHFIFILIYNFGVYFSFCQFSLLIMIYFL